MSERTRLDEIVEEEWREELEKKMLTNTLDMARRIAERAFRLGLETARDVVDEKWSDLYDTIYRTAPPDTEAARPSEEKWVGRSYEKCGPCCAPNCWCRRYNKWTERICGIDVERPLHGDSRKG